ncbi:prephenate dehydratase [Kocuria rhizophila]|uniref:prephenate dehydratase n=1 Tax=Kocuria rhizophila TaxID=72000 RepID=UPI0011AAAD93|nr:prephenate dehydratase [Kocuria rhizophila]MCC5673638.1 prephenate dehydratase [Kocuria rhizophila]MDV5999840.1 prephenate dehydratase [Kocuria rhizophila]WTI32238.1 prephenate dehydratase [Kocuria rhizophila]
MNAAHSGVAPGPVDPGPRPLRYAFLGPEGTFTEAALLRVPGADAASRTPVNSVPAALGAVREGRMDAAVVPIENSVEGGVTATLDAVSFGAELRILREILVPIQFVLVAPEATSLADVSTVSTHSHAWAQVRGWVEENLPGVAYVPAASTAASAVAMLDGHGGVSTEGLGYDAAVCSPVVVQRHPELTVLAEDIGDNKQAVTRFVLVARPDAPMPAPTGADKTSLVVPLWEDRPGALLDILEQFATRGVNLTRIESRPTKTHLGDYFFSVDIDGHIHDARVAEALMGVRRICPRTRFLGSYPRADERAVPVATHHSDAAFIQARSWVDNLKGQ